VEQNRVTILAGLLIIADGLERDHMGNVQDIKASITRKEITLTITSEKDCLTEIDGGTEKSDLFQRCFERTVTIEVAS
jgi:hypothetical protein